MSHHPPDTPAPREFPRRRDLRRAEEEAARTGQRPVVEVPVVTGPVPTVQTTSAAPTVTGPAAGAPSVAGPAPAAPPVTQVPPTEPGPSVGTAPTAPAPASAAAPVVDEVTERDMVTRDILLAGERDRGPDADSYEGHGLVTPGTPVQTAEGEPAPDYGRAGRNLPAAIGVGVTLGGAVLASLIFLPVTFLVIAVIGVGAAMWELDNALSRSGSQVSRLPTLVAAICMILATYFGGREALWVTFTIGAGAILLFTLVERRDNAVKDVSLSLFALTYVGLMGSFIVYMLSLPQGNHIVILFLALVVASDIGGYIFGVLWGKHPIAPQISPKKSWEGYAGSAVFSTLVGVIMGITMFDAPFWTGIVMGLLIPAFATLGDFSESMIKRDLDLKDMGTLLPGHGGVMDRLDSILPTAPVALILFTLLPGFIDR